MIVNEVWTCLEHAQQGRLQVEALIEGLASEGLDSRVTLRVLFPRRYGGGKGIGRSDQLPLQLCTWCQGVEDR